MGDKDKNSEHYNIIFKDDQLTDNYTEYFSRGSVNNDWENTKLFDDDLNGLLASSDQQSKSNKNPPISSESTTKTSKKHEKSVKLENHNENANKKLSSKRKKRNKVIFNCVNTKYPIIKEVAKALGWKFTTADNDEWDVYWSDLAIPQERLVKMKNYQKINHFPAMYQI